MNLNERKLIADFTGLPLEGDPRKNRPPATMEDIVEKIWGTWKIGAESSPEQIISENWGKIVGHGFANKCAPEKLDVTRGVLIIKTSGGAIKQELAFKRKSILKKICQLDSTWKIKDIRIH
ncbi:DUF721 domain-containing protein [Opitutales bacterium]|nr:DUF721 domain-containing protein [Opitutales bacterium]MDA8990309.1 DUF721 domain-containing protein [Opitutales bacterium]